MYRTLAARLCFASRSHAANAVGRGRAEVPARTLILGRATAKVEHR